MSNWEVANRLYGLLKKPLGLGPKTKSFTLHVDCNGPTTVTEEKFMDNESIVEEKDVALKDLDNIPEHQEAYKSTLTGEYYDSIDDIEEGDASRILRDLVFNAKYNYNMESVYGEYLAKAWDDLTQAKQELLLKYYFKVKNDKDN